MTTRITKTKALQLLKNAVDRRGKDYVYPRVGNCAYIVNGTEPSCLVGEVLVEAGLRPSVLYGTKNNKLRIDGIREEIAAEVVITDEAAEILAEAQDAQDAGSPWGDALKLARRRARELPQAAPMTQTIAHVALHETLEAHGAAVRYVQTYPGAAVDLVEFELALKTKLAKIQALAPDLALAVGVESVRILAPIPGTTNIGIEVPAADRTTVAYRPLREYDGTTPHQDGIDFIGVLPFPVGQRVGNGVIWADLAEAPHLLIAGATGSGKSVALNTILTSLIDHVDATSLRLHLVDPKRVELGQFKAAPQVESFVTDVDDAVDLLGDLVDEMERRYTEFEVTGVRNITEFNNEQVLDDQKLPYHVLVIDEMADLMSQRKDDVEAAVQRLTQLARAAGIHLIIATQRPSVNVITGVIKANIPTRWAFTVASQTDSRVILDANGAEALYGAGDSLWAPYGSLKAQRVQGAWTSDAEVERAVRESIARHATWDGGSTLNQSASEEGDPLTLEDTGVYTAEDAEKWADTARRLEVDLTEPIFAAPGVNLSKPIFAAPGVNGGRWFNAPERLDEAHGWRDVGYITDDDPLEAKERKLDRRIAWANLATAWAVLIVVVALVVVAL